MLLLQWILFILSLHKLLHQVGNVYWAVLVGFFVSIGCSAIFYLYVTLQFVGGLRKSGRWDVDSLKEDLGVVIRFMVISGMVSDQWRQWEATLLS